MDPGGHLRLYRTAESMFSHVVQAIYREINIVISQKIPLAVEVGVGKQGGCPAPGRPTPTPPHTNRVAGDVDRPRVHDNNALNKHIHYHAPSASPTLAHFWYFMLFRTKVGSRESKFLKPEMKWIARTLLHSSRGILR